MTGAGEILTGGDFHTEGNFQLDQGKRTPLSSTKKRELRNFEKVDVGRSAAGKKHQAPAQWT